MYSGILVFFQILSHLHMKEFRRCAERYRGEYNVKMFSCWDQFLCMAFAQTAYHESLRDIEACLRSMQGKFYNMGIRD